MKSISIEMLYRNCIYSSIAHAVYILKKPLFSYEQSWDDGNYSIHYGMTRGTISFDLKRQIAAGAFRDENSSYLNLYPNQIRAVDFFDNAPEIIKEYASNEAMMYLFDTIEDYTGPVITASFWINNCQMDFGEDEKSFLKHGGSVLEILMNGEFELKEYWKKQYDFSDSESDLVDILFKAFVQNKKDVKLDRALKVIAKENGYTEMIRSLAEIGMSIKFRGLL